MISSAAARRVVVVGAGAFGGWTALELARHGAHVTLLEAWGPGHTRASSGGETRVIRAGYGARAHYTTLAIRALQLWRQRQREWNQRFFHQTGVLWLFADDSAFAHATADALSAHGASFDVLSRQDAARRYPQMVFEEDVSVLFEQDAGYLLARHACEAVVERFRASGGLYRQGAVRSAISIADGPLARLPMADDSDIEADVWVFACGAWLGRLFPDIVGHGITPTRQEVFYFGTPAGDPRFTDAHLPAWIEIGAAQVYGVPGNAHRGLKIADDSAGPAMDPTSAERTVSPERTEAARAHLARRFPDLARAPLVGAEVCQYEATPDAEFVIDRHPGAANVWIVGGGSGHGFKMGPAVGELVASHVLGHSDPDPRFALARFARAPAEGWQPKWL